LTYYADGPPSLFWRDPFGELARQEGKKLAWEIAGLGQTLIIGIM